MRFSIITLLPLLSVLVAAIPIPDNTSSQEANQLGDGINKGLDASNKEFDSLNNFDSVQQNNPTAAQTADAVQGVQDALDTAKAQRKANQELASRANPEAKATLDQIEVAQGKAQAAVDSLKAGNADAADTLKTIYNGGQKKGELALSQAVSNQD